MVTTVPPKGAAVGTLPAVAPPSIPELDHLSWSGIKTYADCPRKFAYRYIENAPEEFVASSLAFGHAVHSVYESMHQSRMEGRRLPTMPELMDWYQTAWHEETVRGVDVKYGKNESPETLNELAVKVISTCRAHVEEQNRAGTQVIGIEHSVRFRLIVDVPKIEMRLDLLELRGTDLVVTDLKTSKCSWNEDKTREHLPQLVLYAHGLMPLLKAVGAKRIVPRFLVITKGKTPKQQLIEPQASLQDSENLKARIRDTWTAIKAGVFVKRESWACAQCPYKRKCLGA